MSALTISVGNREYKIACDNGQEQALAQLASQIDLHAQDLISRLGSVPENMLLLMACLTLADELRTTNAENAELRAQLNHFQFTADDIEQEKERLANTVITNIASHIERMADRIEGEAA